MVPFRRAYSKSIQKGSLINFNYLFYKHDPTPLVLVTSIYHDGKIAGINLHYLTYRYVRNMIKNFCGDGSFSYQKIKGDTFLYNSFRTYKRVGVKNLHILDCEVLNKTLSVIRSFRFTPNELLAMQNQIRQQLQDIKNQNAEELTGKMQSTLNPFQHSMFTMDKRLSPKFNPPAPPPIPGT